MPALPALPGAARAGSEIAAALELNYVFLCEFVELRSTQRDVASQGGGIHGNAIMTRFDFDGFEKIEHSYHPIDWDSDDHQLSRRAPGQRSALFSPPGPRFGG